MSVLSVLGVYGIVLVAIGFIFRSLRNTSSFHLDSRSVGVFGTLAGLFTLVGAGEFVTTTALAYNFGIWVLMLFGGVALGLTAVSFFAGRIRDGAGSFDLHSIPDFLYIRFGRLVSLPASLICILSLCSLLLIQLVVGGMMFQMLTGLDYAICALLMALIVTVYVLLGGLRSVLATDKLQMSFIILLAVLYLAFFDLSQPLEEFRKDLQGEAAPLDFSFSFLLFGFLAMFGSADVWQRIYAAGSDRAVAHGLKLSATGIFLFGVLIYWMALGIRAVHPDLDPDNAFTTFLGELPGELAVIMALIVFSSILSTADTELFVTSVMIHKEFSRGSGREMNVSSSRLIIIGMAVAISVCAVFMHNLVGIYMSLLFLMMIVGWVTLPVLMGRGNRITALTSIIGGIAVLVILFVTGGLANGWLQMLILVPGLPCWFIRREDNNEFKSGEGLYRST
jgi:SSS family solute:Na+ symporter